MLVSGCRGPMYKRLKRRECGKALPAISSAAFVDIIVAFHQPAFSPYRASRAKTYQKVGKDRIDPHRGEPEGMRAALCCRRLSGAPRDWVECYSWLRS